MPVHHAILKVGLALNPSSPFASGSPVATIPAHEVVAWTRRTGSDRLLLPPIQRSLVWRNIQILNYWDSLLRGYPAGLMMVHPARSAGSGAFLARTADGVTCPTSAGDFQLFDGQQRLSALLLGYGHGQLARKLRLWVDLGVDSEPGSGLLFQLRVSSSGQPFGYQAAAPNQKFSLGQRTSKIEAWRKDRNLATFDPREAFEAVKGSDVIGGVCTFPLVELIDLVAAADPAARLKLLQDTPGLAGERLDVFLSALDGALGRPILFQRIDEAVLAEESEYIRFFGRLGQGGTALSQDELTYSIIKHQYPEVHDRMTEIMRGPAGRLTGEVNLVLGAIRVAKVLSGWKHDNIWQVIGRPNPSFVSQLKELPEVEAAFQELIPSKPGGRLVTVLEGIRERLVYHRDRNPGGLPMMLLARIPHQLVDVLLLLAHLPDERPGEDPLPAFALHWLLFVSDNDRAASHVFRQFVEARPSTLAGGLPTWIDQFERDGIAHPIPLPARLPAILDEVRAGNHRLREWSERFTGLDADADRPKGNSLRVLSSQRELIKRALLWLQRKQLSESYPHFDPTSEDDEDLPIDLDHRIPSEIFGFHWRKRFHRLAFEDSDGNFFHGRNRVGNSLGNFRWLDASENRSRSDGPLEPDDLVPDVDPWNRLIEKATWDLEDAAAFQCLIDEQTITLFHALLEEGGIARLRSSNRDAGESEAARSTEPAISLSDDI